MKNLFEEYMKDVLEVEAQPSQMLNIPRPLSELLKETEEKREDTKKRLNEQRRQTQGIVKQLQKQLKTINKRLRALD
jgi:uncharacterized FlaG/YvyC family protein